jgi:hypothetical protein
VVVVIMMPMTIVVIIVIVIDAFLISPWVDCFQIIPDQNDVKDFLGSGQHRDFYYVAQDNLEVVEAIGDIMTTGNSDDIDFISSEDVYDGIQADRLLNQIKNREVKTIRNVNMDRYFGKFNIKTGTYDAAVGIDFCFSLLPRTSEMSKNADDEFRDKKYKDVEKLLLETFNQFNKFFLSFQSLSAGNHLLLMLKHASIR